VTSLSMRLDAWNWTPSKSNVRWTVSLPLSWGAPPARVDPADHGDPQVRLDFVGQVAVTQAEIVREVEAVGAAAAVVGFDAAGHAGEPFADADADVLILGERGGRQ
jgi:hypothetical protein